MLEPRDRLLLFDALRPPEGFRFDEGVGTTYTLDLVALLTAPLAFTWFEQSDDGEQIAAIDSLEILESLRRHADRLTIFCHAGRIALPRVFNPQLMFLENAIIECAPANGGAFHSKVWVLRFMNDAGDVRYRFLCLSRNLTFARSWDTLLALDGNLSPTRKSSYSRNRELAAFIRALPRMATRQPIDAAISTRIETLASEVERTEFELPNEFTDVRFWPLGIGGRNPDPLADAGSRLLIVSPFLTLGRLEKLAEGRKDVTLVSSAYGLGGLQRKPEGISKFFVLSDRAQIEVDPDSDEKPEGDVEAVQQSDLHAKLYVSENGWDAHVWTGSANATTAAFNGNVEFLVELIGPRKRYGIDALMQPEKGEIRFVNLLQEAEQLVACEPVDSTIESLERRLDDLRAVIASAVLEANIATGLKDTFDCTVTCRSTESRIIDPGFTLRCWPVTVTSTIGVKIDRLDSNAAVASFPGLSFNAITSFFAFELTGRTGAEERQLRFVLNLPLIGAPEHRREEVLRSMVRDKSRMLRFLWLLLAEEGAFVPPLAGLGSGRSDRADARSQLAANGLFEMLLRTLERSPRRLDDLNNLLTELRTGIDEEDLLPVGFDEIWEPIWRRRARLRPEGAA